MLSQKEHTQCYRTNKGDTTRKGTLYCVLLLLVPHEKKIIHFLPLTSNYANLKELLNQGLEIEVTTKDTKKRQTLNKIFRPWGTECKFCFRNATLGLFFELLVSCQPTLGHSQDDPLITLCVSCILTVFTWRSSEASKRLRFPKSGQATVCAVDNLWRLRSIWKLNTKRPLKPLNNN